MTHPVMYSLLYPLSNADPESVQEALNMLREELDSVARGNLGYEPIEQRIDRLEAFTLLAEQHAANVHNYVK